MKFWEKVSEYIEAEEEEDYNYEEPIDPDTDINDSYYEETEETEETAGTALDELHLLLQIIKMIHNKRSRYSGFTRPFDLEKLIDKLPYYDNGSNNLNSKEVCLFINEYRQSCDSRGYDYCEKDSFYKFLERRCQIKEEEKLRRHLDTQ